MAFLHDRAFREHVVSFRDPVNEAEVLFDQQQRGARVRELAQDDRELVDDHGCETLARLVEYQQRGVRHQGAADRQHLLLAARQRGTRRVGPLAQDRKQVEHAIEGPGLVAAGGAADHQVFPHGQGRDDAAALRHHGDAAPRGHEMADRRMALSGKSDFAARQSGDAEEGIDDRRLADAVAAENCDALAVADRQIDVMQDAGVPVAGHDVAEGE